MAIPTYDKFIEPILRYLAKHPEGVPASTVYEAASTSLGINEDDKLALLPSRTQPVYKNRAGWAHDRLKRAGLSSSPRRGFWKLTDAGVEYAQSHSTPLTEDQVKDLAVADPAVRLRPLPVEYDDATDQRQLTNLQHAVTTPDDRLESALTELRDAAAEDLLETIGRGSPKFFETLVLDLLHSMGMAQVELTFSTLADPGTVELMASFPSTALDWKRSLFRPRGGKTQ